ncbi:MAG: DUF5915 domain-containing protein, partial [Psychroflexus sp.]
NFKVLGPRFGKEMKHAVQAIQKLEAADISKVEQEKSLEIDINGEKTNISIDEVEIISQDIEGWLVASSNGVTVALDVSLTDELINEGIARELVNRIQNMRKDSGFEVTDKITIEIQKTKKIEKAVEANFDYIKLETLAENLYINESVENGIEIEFDDVKTVLNISKIN